MEITTIQVKESKTNHSELYRDLEFIDELPRIKTVRDTKRKTFYDIVKWTQFFRKKKVLRTQAEVFQEAMKLVVFCGQSVGLLPFLGVLEKEACRIRYKKCSVRFVYCCMMCAVQSVALMLSLLRLLTNTISVAKLGYFSFYLSTCLTSIIFLRLASKWQKLMKQISSVDLNEYIDQSVKSKCNFAIIILFTTGLIEHVLSIISEMSDLLVCYSPEQDLHRIYIETTYPWLFEIGVTYSVFLGIILPILNFASTVIWSYSHLFIICISYFLSSILEQINKKIKSHEGEYLPSSYWKKLREDYSHATQLVRVFDEVINNIVFASFASNLFFVCLRLYHILAFGIKTNSKVESDECLYYTHGYFHGYELTIYLSFSLAFVIMRSLAVTLVAARVHSASLVPATYLYKVPSPAYCTEVERFIEQVHGDTVALSGLNFFYVTKELVLSVAGTIVTYELVLLQFN